MLQKLTIGTILNLSQKKEIGTILNIIKDFFFFEKKNIIPALPKIGPYFNLLCQKYLTIKLSVLEKQTGRLVPIYPLVIS